MRLSEPGNDTLIGGDDEDVLLGGRGDDTIDAGGGNDVVYGDLVNDLLPFSPGAPLVQTGIRILDSAELNGECSPENLGVSFVPRMMIYPDDIQSVDPGLALPFEHVTDIFANSPNIHNLVGMLPGDDGTAIVPYADGASTAIDLLTAVMHELGHVLGLADLASEDGAHNLMTGELAPGVRRLAANHAS